MYEAAINILNILYKHGFDAYIIGGYVRDKLLEKESNDIDITTNAKPNELKFIFKESTINEDNYGSVRLKYMKYTFEVTTFRRDIGNLNNRKPKRIKYVSTLSEDILRRDFTINTICIDYNGNYFDILNGKSDIEKRIIKTVVNPSISIKNDSFRILRAIRFACILNFKLDDSLIGAIKNYKYLLDNISFYRKKAELDTIFSSNNVHYGIKLITDLELDKILKIKGLDGIRYTKDYLGIWAQLDYSDNYNFTKEESRNINEIRQIIKYKDINKFILYKYKLSNILIVSEILDIPSDKVMDTYNKMQIHSRRDINIPVSKIKNITSLKISDLYIDLENEILYNNLKNETDDILNYIKNKYGE